MKASTARELWESCDKGQWLKYVSGYPSCIRQLANSKKKGPGTLVEDDEWIRKQVPKLISSGEFNAASMSRVMRWKLSKGKFRPGLQQKADSLDDNEVQEAVKKSQKYLPGDVKSALRCLTEFNGIGPATASAVIAAVDGTVPFFSDEAFTAATNVKSIKYTEKSYLEYCNLLSTKSTSLNSQRSKRSYSDRVISKKFTAEEVQRALWSCHFCDKNNFSIPEEQTEESDNDSSEDRKLKRPKMDDKFPTTLHQQAGEGAIDGECGWACVNFIAELYGKSRIPFSVMDDIQSQLHDIEKGFCATGKDTIPIKGGWFSLPTVTESISQVTGNSVDTFVTLQRGRRNPKVILINERHEVMSHWVVALRDNRSGYIIKDIQEPEYSVRSMAEIKTKFTNHDFHKID